MSDQFLLVIHLVLLLC